MLLTIGRAAQPVADDAVTENYNERWAAYMRDLIADGVIESAAPFEPSARLVSADADTPVDLNEVDIGGYTLINVQSLDAAIDIARRAPHIAIGGTTIVRPCVDVRQAG
jgi:hypothetical protein